MIQRIPGLLFKRRWRFDLARTRFFEILIWDNEGLERERIFRGARIVTGELIFNQKPNRYRQKEREDLCDPVFGQVRLLHNWTFQIRKSWRCGHEIVFR